MLILSMVAVGDCFIIGRSKLLNLEQRGVIKEISNSAYLSDSHREKLIKSLKDDTVFFKNKRYVPPIPNEFFPAGTSVKQSFTFTHQ